SLPQSRATGRARATYLRHDPLVDRMLGAPLASFNPLRSARALNGRALLLIHSRSDRNATTPLSAALALQQAVGPNASLWIAPRGGHADALAANRAAYQQRVIAFFRHTLH
ncbi:MAG: hypothetical protein M3Z66_10080, partial [Chloroflexota bacterium]|nr:hypothetical protein [Chloroflexota bacterium]